MADRAALDLEIPPSASAVVDQVDALVDDFRPFAVEEVARPIETDRAQPATVRRIHFFSHDDRAAAAEAITQRFGGEGVLTTPVEVVDDGETWARRCQANLRTVQIDNIVIAPPWDIPLPTEGITTVVIEPSIGFGTGHHASTRLCIRALQRRPVRAVIDLGTGSGVLAITAAKLGAASVLAIDNDPDAVGAARRNILRNGVGSVVTLRCEDLRSLTPPAAILFANLTGAMLCTRADPIAHCVAPGGTLILSGLGLDEEARVREAFGPSVTRCDRLCEDEWSCLVLTLDT